MKKILVSDLTVHAACNKVDNKYIYFDAHYAGMKVGSVDLSSGKVNLHHEPDIFEYEDCINEKLIACLIIVSDVEINNGCSNVNGFVKLDLVYLVMQIINKTGIVGTLKDTYIEYLDQLITGETHCLLNYLSGIPDIDVELYNKVLEWRNK